VARACLGQYLLAVHAGPALLTKDYNHGRCTDARAAASRGSRKSFSYTELCVGRPCTMHLVRFTQEFPNINDGYTFPSAKVRSQGLSALDHFTTYYSASGSRQE
jgi:hypothetical protein